MKHPALLFFTLALLLPLRAQNVPTPADAPDSTAAMTTPDSGAAPTLSHMPAPLDHKPNPTDPAPEIAVPIDRFFKTLKTGDYAGAYETFLAGTRMGQQKEKVSYQVSKTEEAFGHYGKLNNAEIYDNFSIGHNIIVLTYLTRHENQPLRWRFIYYRADKSWMLINMGFDDPLLEWVR
jgi:hypothetical protein